MPCRPTPLLAQLRKALRSADKPAARLRFALPDDGWGWAHRPCRAARRGRQYVYMCIYIYIYTHICIYIYIEIYMCTHTYIHTYVYTRIYIYIYTYHHFHDREQALTCKRRCSKLPRPRAQAESQPQPWPWPRPQQTPQWLLLLLITITFTVQVTITIITTTNSIIISSTMSIITTTYYDGSARRQDVRDSSSWRSGGTSASKTNRQYCLFVVCFSRWCLISIDPEVLVVLFCLASWKHT